MTLSPLVQFLVVLVSGFLNRQQQDVITYLRAEVAVLRELAGPGRLDLTDEHRRLLARAGQQLGRRALAGVASLVTPDTILRWYRELVALHHLGHDLARSTVAAILESRGIVPAPERSRTTRWRDFLSAHAATLCAADFFSAEVLTWTGVVRYQVLFVMHVATRRVTIAGIRRDPSEAWMRQLACNLTDAIDGFLLGMRYLILDRDPLFGRRFRDVLRSSGVKIVRLPRESPNLNAFAERWVRSCREDCLDRFVIVGEAHLRRLVTSYAEHFNAERPHQGLDGAFVTPDPRAKNRSGRVVRQDRLGGVLRFYHRAAA